MLHFNEVDFSLCPQLSLRNPFKLSVALHICNPSTQRLRQEDLEFEASLATQF
jgi:hypothetical protein